MTESSSGYEPPTSEVQGTDPQSSDTFRQHGLSTMGPGEDGKPVAKAVTELLPPIPIVQGHEPGFMRADIQPHQTSIPSESLVHGSDQVDPQQLEQVLSDGLKLKKLSWSERLKKFLRRGK